MERDYRVYVDRKIVRHEDGTEKGGDHSRVVDVRAEDEAGARAKVELKRGEEINQIVGVTFDVGAP